MCAEKVCGAEEVNICKDFLTIFKVAGTFYKQEVPQQVWVAYLQVFSGVLSIVHILESLAAKKRAV